MCLTVLGIESIIPCSNIRSPITVFNGIDQINSYAIESQHLENSNQHYRKSNDENVSFSQKDRQDKS